MIRPHYVVSPEAKSRAEWRAEGFEVIKGARAFRVARLVRGVDPVPGFDLLVRQVSKVPNVWDCRTEAFVYGPNQVRKIEKVRPQAAGNPATVQVDKPNPHAPRRALGGKIANDQETVSSSTPTPSNTTRHCHLPYDGDLPSFLTDPEGLSSEAATGCEVINRRNTRRMFSRYLPEGFDWEKVPEPIRDSVQEFVSTLYLERLENRATRDEWNPISAVIFRRTCGSKDKADKARWWAVENGLAECDRLYRKGEKCLGYRLSPAIRETTFRLHPIADKAFVRRMRNSPNACTTRLQRHLERQASAHQGDRPGRPSDGGIPGPRARERRQQGAEPRGRIRRQVPFHDHQHEEGFPPTFRVDGERLMEADVRNCQPLALVAVLQEQGVDCPEYRRLCEEGTLYEFLADEAGVSREQAKRELITCAFFGRNGSRSPTKTAFGKAFPKAARAIREIKRKDYTELARRLQKAESSVIVRTACETLRKKHPGMFYTPITTHRRQARRHRDRCLRHQGRFARIGLDPKIETKWL